jgi:hypothetical protein
MLAKNKEKDKCLRAVAIGRTARLSCIRKADTRLVFALREVRGL